MTTKNRQDSVTMWQTAYEDDGIPEPALVITHYVGNIIGIMQGGNEILVNAASINEFIKNIRNAAKEAEK